jgi:hypothetical protein
MRYRNIIIAIAAAATLAAASATGALARGGGMGGGHGGMGGGHMGGGHMGGHMGGGWSGHAVGMGFASRAAVAHVGPVGFAGARSVAWHGNHVAFGRHFPFRHRFVRNRFFFAGAPYAYAYYDDGCYTRVWTAWGWRWTNVCSY